MKRNLTADAAAREIAERISSWLATAGPEARYEDIIAARASDVSEMTESDRTTLRQLLLLMLAESDRKAIS